MGDPSKQRAKEIHGWTELDLVKFKVAGMPVKWKIINLIFIWFPKLYIWLVTLDAGIVFLLETAVIDDMIINAVALAFILSVDELICSTLVSPISLYMVSHLEPYYTNSIADEEDDTEKEAWDKHQLTKNWSFCSCQFCELLVPWRLIAILWTTLFFVVKYYMEHCSRGEDGSWVSQDVFLPQADTLSFWT